MLCVELPQYLPGNLQGQKIRNETWNTLNTKGTVDFLTKSGGTFAAFDTSELDFNYCLLTT